MFPLFKKGQFFSVSLKKLTFFLLTGGSDFISFLGFTTSGFLRWTKIYRRQLIDVDICVTFVVSPVQETCIVLKPAVLLNCADKFLFLY